MPKGIVGLPAQLRDVYKKLTARKMKVEPAPVAANGEEPLPAKSE
jgi:hypothetical protein